MSEKQNQHEMIQALTDLAIEIGRTPTLEEFSLKTGISKYHVVIAFGGFRVLVQAAGLHSATDCKAKSKSLPNSVFEKNIEAHIEEINQPKPEAIRHDAGTLAVISDIHWPFHNRKVTDRFIEYVGDEKPDYAVIDGDAWDMYCHSKYPTSANKFNPKEEETMARKLNEEFWKSVKKAYPKVKCFQMLGNHDVRPLKRTVEAMPTMDHWIKERFEQLFTFDGVTTYLDAREELLIGDICIHHGYRSKLGDHRDDLLMNTIVGHTHKPGVVFRKLQDKVIWEMNCGLAGNPDAKGLSYTPQRIVNWSPAFGTVNRYGPQVVIV